MRNRKTIVYRDFQITVISARNLENLGNFFNMQVYAKVSFNRNRKTEKKTPVDKNNGVNPAWNFRINGYKIAEDALQHDGLMLVVKLYCKGKLGCDRYISEAYMQVRELFNTAAPQGQGRGASPSLQLQNGSAPPADDSVVNISYYFGDRIEVEERAMWKKVLLYGAAILLQVTMLSTLGVDSPIRVIKESKIIR